MSAANRVTTKADERRHEFLGDIAEHTALRLIKVHGVADEKAADIGEDLSDFLSKHWSKQTIYIPNDARLKLNERDLQIYQRMERGNAHDLAKEFGISFVRVYQIHRTVLKALRAEANAKTERPK